MAARITPKQIIGDCLEIIQDEDSWCQKNMALNTEGKPCCPTDPDADKWDALGLIIRTGKRLNADDNTIFHTTQIVQGNLGQGYNHNLTRFNDEKTHEEVVALFEKTLSNFPRGSV